jgi:general transcription factor 3C polypeptide 5 (transcription factor C subunit 1)
MDDNESARPAPAHPLPSQHFYSIEYPGYVSPESIPIAMHTMGGQTCIDNVFRRVQRNRGRDNVVDLKLRPDNPFCHPVPGEVTSTNNLLLRVVKKKRRVLGSTGSSFETVGEYTAQIVGIIPKTLRFRSEFLLAPWVFKLIQMFTGMVDFQYQPDMEQAIPQLRNDMDRFDGESCMCMLGLWLNSGQLKLSKISSSSPRRRITL